VTSIVRTSAVETLLSTHVKDIVNAVNVRLSAWDGEAAEAFKVYLSRLPIAAERSQVVHALEVVRSDLHNEWRNTLLPPPNHLTDLQSAGVDVIAGQHLFYCGPWSTVDGVGAQATRWAATREFARSPVSSSQTTLP
jgi:hypothetical protein